MAPPPVRSAKLDGYFSSVGLFQKSFSWKIEIKAIDVRKKHTHFDTILQPDYFIWSNSGKAQAWVVPSH